MRFIFNIFFLFPIIGFGQAAFISGNDTICDDGSTADVVVSFSFGQPPYAQPGETIFSFVAQPGERATLGLDKIKALTNTTLGGRGTFPNGPDVLAINVFRTAGAGNVSSTITLRWSEAQA